MNTLTALYRMSKIQRRQPKSVNISWDKQGFLLKKKKFFYTHQSDYHLELQGILPGLFQKLHKYYIADSRTRILAI